MHIGRTAKAVFVLIISGCVVGGVGMVGGAGGLHGEGLHGLEKAGLAQAPKRRI